MEKQNDYFLNQLYNPGFSPGDFVNIGINTSNTSLQDKDVYKNIDAIRNNPALQTNGEFDGAKFDRMYAKALAGYNQMAQAKSDDDLASSMVAFKENIFAKPEQRKLDNESSTYITRILNPNRQSGGFGTWNSYEAPTMSSKEVAESNKAYNPETGTWEESPNDRGMFGTLLDAINPWKAPKVLDTWEEDGVHTDFWSGEQVQHKKGELKLGPGGEYQYRSLKKGEDIYGKEVLHASDVLTVDGSAFNKYDFFDNDDLNPSTGKSLLRAAVKIVPAFIPGVNSYYLGARVALNAGDLFAKLGKMAIGTEGTVPDMLTKLEALNQTTSFGTSAYSTGDQGLNTVGHSWSFENLLGLASDVFTQLGEQRWVFTKFPSWYKKINPAIFENSKKGQKALQEMQREEMLKFGKADFLKTIEGKQLTPKEISDTLKAESFAYANAQIQSKMGEVQKLGASLSKLYMTGITVADSYGEAKNQGLSDVEAALFTLGYATAEYGLLSTELGEHILPELKIQKQQMKSIARTLNGISEKVKAENLPTKKWYEKIFNFGKEIATGNYSNATLNSKVLGIAANALGEGTEEVSEEALLDFSKALFNIQQSIRNRPTMETFDGGDVGQVLSRYAQNFIGGLLGGGIATQLPGFREQWKNLKITDNSQAWQEFVALIRNGKKDEFISTVNKMSFASDVLSAQKSNGTTGDEVDNLDKQMKQNIKNIADFVDDFMKSEGAKYNDDTILTKLTGMDQNLKFAALKESTISGKYLQDFNTLVTDIVAQKAIIDDITTHNTDHKVALSSEDESHLKAAQNKLAEDQKILAQYNDGTRFKDYVKRALFELNPIVSGPYTTATFVQYAQRVEGKPLNEINPKRLNYLKKKWDDYSELDKADQIMAAYDIFEAVNNKTSQLIEQHVDQYIKSKNEVSTLEGQIDAARKTDFINQAQEQPETALKRISEYQKYANIEDSKSRANMLTNYLLHSINGDDINVDNVFESNYDDPENGYEFPFQEAIPSLKGKGLTELLKFVDSLPTTLEEVSQHPELSMYYAGQTTDEGVNQITEINKGDLLRAIFRNADIINKIGDFIKNKVSFLDVNTRNYLKNMFNTISSGNFDMLGDNNKEVSDAWDNLLDIVAKKPFTPMEQLLDQFIFKNGEQNLKITNILDILDSRLKDSIDKGDISKFSYNDNLQQSVEDALLWCDILQSHIVAAESDGKSLGNYGYNITLNEIDPESKLAVIDRETAQLLLDDLYKVRQQLYYYHTIFKVNTNQKLKAHNEIRAKFSVFKWQKLTSLLNEDFPDNWVGKDDLISVLEQCATIKALRDNTDEKKYQVDDETQTKLFKEEIQIQDALYKFLQDNKSKVTDGTLANILKDKLNFLSRNNEEVSVDSTLPNDRSFFWWLASNMAVKASDFYANYKTILIGDFAPIPGQEEAVKMGYSFITNRQVFRDFAKIYNEIVKSNTKGLSDKEISDINNNLMMNYTKDSGDDNDFTLQIVNTLLLEGVPGSGKSTGYYTTLLRLLYKYHSDQLKNKIWLVHINKEKAERLAQQLAKSMNIDNWEDMFICMGKNDYLKKINENYTPQLLQDDGTLKTDLSTLKQDTDTKLFHYKEETINASLTPPSLVIMDEVTRFSQQDMLLSDKFQEQFGIAGIATGDFDQLGAIGTFKSSDKEDADTISLSLNRNNYIGGIRLGTSMRTSNLVKDYNIQDAKTKLYDLIHTITQDTPRDEMKIHLNYYQNNDKTSKNYGLYGDKIESFKENFKQDVLLMLDSLEEGETVNFIASDKSSPLYQYIKTLQTSSQYKGKIKIVDSSDAQGDEAQYYIAELPNNPIDRGNKEISNADKIAQASFQVKQFYTAISRAKQATLIVRNEAVADIATSSEVKTPDVSPLSKQGILDYTNSTKRMFDQVITNPSGNVQFIPLSGKKTEIKETETPPPNEPNNDFEGDAAPSTTGIETIENGEQGVFNMLTYDMPVNETGGYRVENSSSPIGYDIKPGLNSEDRIDGVNGMLKIIGESRRPNAQLNSNGVISDPESVLHKLSTIRSAGLFYPDKASIVEEVKRQLDIRNQDIGVDFVYIQKPVQDGNPSLGEAKHNSNKFIRFIKDKLEYVMGIFKGENESARTKQAERDKYIEMIVYRKDKKDGKEVRTNILEVPLLIFTSPLTMLETKGFEKLKDAYYNGFVGRENSLIEFLDFLQNNETGKNLPNSENMVKLLKLYTRKGNEGDFVYYFDDDFTLASKATQITGPYIINHDKGSKYIYNKEDFGYGGTWTKLDELDKGTYKHSKVYALEQDELDDKGNVIAKAGTYFMIVSTKFDNLDDRGMIEAYHNQKGKGGPYNMIFVDTPKVGISEYFQNAEYLRIRLGANEESSIDKHLGNMLTIFRLSQAFAKDNSNFDKRYKEIKEKFYDQNGKQLAEIDDQWKLFKQVVQFITQKSKDNKWTPVALIEYLKNPADEELLNFIKDSIGEGKLYEMIKRAKSVNKYITNSALHFANDLRENIMGPAKPDIEDNTPVFGDDILKNHEAISKDVKKTYSDNFDGIFVRGINNGQDISIDGNNYRGIECDSNMHMVSGKDYGSFTVNGKIDPTSMVFDIFQMITDINDSIDKGSSKGTKWAYDVNRYTKDGWEPNTEENPKEEKLSYKDLISNFINPNKITNLIKSKPYKNWLKNHPNTKEMDISKDINLFLKVLDDLRIPTFFNKGKFDIFGTNEDLIKEYRNDNYIILGGQDNTGLYQIDNSGTLVNIGLEDYMNTLSETQQNWVKDNYEQYSNDSNSFTFKDSIQKEIMEIYDFLQRHKPQEPPTITNLEFDITNLQLNNDELNLLASVFTNNSLDRLNDSQEVKDWLNQAADAAKMAVEYDDSIDFATLASQSAIEELDEKLGHILDQNQKNSLQQKLATYFNSIDINDKNETEGNSFTGCSIPGNDIPF